MIDERTPKTRLPGLESVVFGVIQATLLELIAMACAAALMLGAYILLRLWYLVDTITALQ